MNHVRAAAGEVRDSTERESANEIADTVVEVTRSHVVVARLKDDYVLAVDEIDEPMFLADSSGPAACEGVA